MIEFYLERHYQSTPPCFEISLNQTVFGHTVTSQTPTMHGDRLQVHVDMDQSQIQARNSLELFFSNKDHHDDNWIEIRNVIVHGIALDWLLYQCTEFRHRMPIEWCDQMRKRGIDIQEVYSPGTVLRLIGSTQITWEEPLWRYKTKKMAESC